jgi:GxxExxY protein
MDKEKPLAKEGYALMAAAFEVHRELGGGMAEEIYQQALQIELATRGISFKAKQELVAHYKGIALERKYIPDLYVFERIVVELKSVSALAAEHEAQLINYMRRVSSPWCARDRRFLLANGNRQGGSSELLLVKRASFLTTRYLTTSHKERTPNVTACYPPVAGPDKPVDGRRGNARKTGRRGARRASATAGRDHDEVSAARDFAGQCLRV